MTQRHVMLLTATGNYELKPTRFARKKGRGYEYGYTKIVHENREKDVDVVLGTALTLSEAMQLNGMEPLNGHDKEGF